MVETSSRGSHRCATERRCEVGVVIDERHDAVEEVTGESTVEVVVDEVVYDWMSMLPTCHDANFW